ncbi:metabotropic glutamate receptor-like protein P [Senna tora]|uniref:Metabotropic glutamate receptor-like protein P n=1 Tax=Senna tora TaxID=362788 RepID=A0A834WZZ9_9FABA|nr:metabotropic glutamate receptor-like protein P [Senna tora]
MFRGGGAALSHRPMFNASAAAKPPPPPPLPARVNWKKGKDFKSNNFKSRYAPFAPRNTTSFLIRSKRSRADDCKTPCPLTPPILPTPIFSPLSEFWIDMAREEWGVDGYGSMKGLIRLRSSPRADSDSESADSDADGLPGGGSSDSDVEKSEWKSRSDWTTT